jgi:transposase
MKHFSPQEKHHILLEYQPHSPAHNLTALAARHSVKGGKRTILNWLQRWDHTAASLEHKKGAGRPHALEHNEVTRYIQQPIRRLNRSAQVVRYTKVANQVREKTGKQVSDRTVRRIGTEELGGRKTRGKKRTAEESKCTHTYNYLHTMLVYDKPTH